MKRGARGFTLIELVLVIVIVGILASVALPRYFANIEKARKAEAVTMMGHLRQALNAYRASNNDTDRAIAVGDLVTVTLDGDVVISVQVPAANASNFNYTHTLDANTIVATASSKAGAGTTNYTMAIDTGVVS